MSEVSSDSYQRMKALIIGDVHLIAAGTTDRFPYAGDNLILSDAYDAVSGVGTNVASTLRRLDIEVDLANAIGSDVFGDAILDDLRKQGIGVAHIQRCPDPTGVFLIFVDPAGERTMVGYRGASARFALGEDLLRAAPYRWVHMSGYTMLNADIPGAFRRLVLQARERGIACSIDLEGVAQAGGQVDLAGLTVFCNRQEYTAYFGVEEIRYPEGAQRLIVKSGASGCFLAEPGGVQHIPAFPAEVCDLTGAGDAFNAGYIAACLRGLSPEDACRWGNAAGSFKVGRRGPRIDLTIDEVSARAGVPCVRA